MHDGLAILKSLGGEALVFEGVVAKGRVEGLFFELGIEQRYSNPGSANIEIVYSFPLPLGAVLLEIAFEIGGKKLLGAVVERPKAERTYEQALEQGDTAILLEQAAPGLYTVNLGNLLPGETAIIRYRYAQLLRLEQGQVRLTIPTVIAPRYGDAIAAGLQPHQVPATDIAVEYPFDLSLDIMGGLAAGGIKSPSHAITIGPSNGITSVRLARKGHLDRDFVLTVAELDTRSLAVLSRDEDGYVALVSFTPPLQSSVDDKPINLKILLDCSGSMAGNSIRTAKAALSRVLEQLTVRDRFTLSRFGSHVEHLVASLTLADDPTVASAAGRIAELDADLGGTEMERALLGVFDLDRRTGGKILSNNSTNADVLLVTDGQIWDTENLLAAARALKNRVFAVAVGSAPSENMLRRLAEGTGGACEFVAPGENAESAILRMFHRMRQRHADQLSVNWPLAPDWMAPLPATLFEGETIHALARFSSLLRGTVTLAYRLDGEVDAQSSAVALPECINEGNQLARLAAARRLPSLSANEATELAVRYQLVTDRTSCVIVHERAENQKGLSIPKLRQIAQMMPAGWGGLGGIGVACEVEMFRDADIHPRSLSHIADAHMEISSSVRALQAPHMATPGAFMHQVARIGELKFFGSSHWPTSISDLERLGLPEEVVDFLRRLATSGEAEAIVVAAFLWVIATTPAGAALNRFERRRFQQTMIGTNVPDDLLRRLMAMLVNTTAETWSVSSQAVVNERP